MSTRHVAYRLLALSTLTRLRLTSAAPALQARRALLDESRMRAE